MFYISCAIASTAVLYAYGISFTFSLLISFLCYVVYQHKWMYIFIMTLPRDIYHFYRLIFCVVIAELRLSKGHKLTIGEAFDETVKKFPDKVGLISANTGKKLTLKDIQDYSNRVGNVFYDQGYRKGDCIAMLMKNSNEYIPMWMGLSKIGVISALINTNQRGETLLHSLKVAKCKAIIYHKCFQEVVDTIKDEIESSITCFVLDEQSDSVAPNEGNKTIDLNNLLNKALVTSPPRPSNLSNKDTSVYIYTSGTTGLPKAAVVTATKMFKGALVFSTFTGVTFDEIVYNTLPMYHASGFIIFTLPMLLTGCTVVVRDKFSVSHFFSDCRKFNVTYIAYIGEMLRYLLLSPETSNDRLHKIRTACGNGLRSSLFKSFKERFGISTIHEFYGATEGNSGFVNVTGVDGSVGHFFKSLSFANVTSLIKIQPGTGEILRNKDGYAIPCKSGEPGLLVNIIRLGTEFNGYVNQKESEKKIARNIFKKGDAYFVSGDILKVDEFGNLFFVDRLGDTYRWKGENTSTTQVENIVSELLNNKEVVVYPVQIPFNEGNAGMAYIALNGDNDVINFDKLSVDLTAELPKHSLPVFLKTGKEVCVTGTQKHQKTILKRQGYAIDTLQQDENVYFYDKQIHNYKLLDEDSYSKIMEGLISF